MLNKTLLSLQLSRLTYHSPLISIPKNTFSGSLLVKNTRISRSFDGFVRSYDNARLDIINSLFQKFLLSVITINPIDDKRCGHIDDKRFHTQNSFTLYQVCTYVRNTTWNDTILTAVHTTGHIQCENCGFYDCSSPNDGGAIYQNSTNDLVLVDTVFFNCSSNGNGGAIWSRTKNIVFYMTTFDNCVSTGGTCLNLEGRSFIAEYFYTTRTCGAFNFTQNAVDFYPGYYVVINHTQMYTNQYFNVDNITIEDADISPPSGYGINGTLTSVASFTNVGFYTTYGFVLPEDCRIINNGIYAPSVYSSFTPEFSGLDLTYNRPVRPARTPSPTSAGETSNSTTEDTHIGLKAGYIVLIVFAVLILIAAILGVIWFCCTRCKCTCAGCCQDEDEVVTYNFG